MNQFLGRIANLSLRVQLTLIVVPLALISSYFLGERLLHQVRAVELIALALTVLLWLFAFLVAHNLRRRMSALQRVLGEIERTGNLSLRTGASHGDEIGQVGAAVDRMLDKFAGVIGKVADASSELAAPAQQLSAISTQTSAGVMRQKQESEQVAAAMNQMAAAVQEVARHAAAAQQAADRADRETEDVQQRVERMLAGMRALGEEIGAAARVIRALEADSRKIDDIVTMISGITDQTNLLALNASIEAARAGEQGRGFAVVANEVRTLASRTQESTGQIQAMVESLQRAANQAVTVMERGLESGTATSALAEQAGEALLRAGEAVGEIRDMNTQIATATEEQSAVAEEMNRNIVALHDLLSQTSQGARETASASVRLAELARTLEQTAAGIRRR